jgi:hypothetical protein
MSGGLGEYLRLCVTWLPVVAASNKLVELSSSSCLQMSCIPDAKQLASLRVHRQLLLLAKVVFEFELGLASCVYVRGSAEYGSPATAAYRGLCDFASLAAFDYSSAA